MKGFTGVLSKPLAWLVISCLISIPTKSLSEVSLKDLTLSHSETTELGRYIRNCEINKKVLKATDESLTACEFERECTDFGWSGMISSFAFGLVIGAALIGH